MGAKYMWATERVKKRKSDKAERGTRVNVLLG
jgi:hypothetical protein